MVEENIKAVSEFEAILKNMNTNWQANDGRIEYLKNILEMLGSPEKDLKIIHIAGTNGKGSTGAMLESILKAHDIKVGVFSTPYVLDPVEQITINGEFVNKQEFIDIYHEITKVLKANGIEEKAITYFEYWTLISFMLFKKHAVDYVILEAGLGGENDATNVVDNTEICVFTKIDLDHQNILGKTITDIANNKAGIIKKDSTVISYSGQSIEANKVLKEKTAEKQAHWFEPEIPTITITRSNPMGLELKIGELTGVFLSLSGAFQAHNLNTVLQVLYALKNNGFELSEEAIIKGLANVKLIGRMEYNADDNLLFDGAHNIDGLRGLIASIKSWHLRIKPTLIFGVLKDKDYRDMIEELMPFVNRVITVTPEEDERALSAEQLAAEIIMDHPEIDVQIAADPTAAISLAKRVRESSKALIVVTGSFYTLRAIKKL